MAGSLLAEAYVVVRAAWDRIAGDLARVRGVIEKGIGRATSGATSAMEGMMGGFANSLGNMAFRAAASGVQSFVSEIVQASAQFENFQISLNTLYGSVEAGAKAFDEFKVFALQTPFDLRGIVESARKLRIVGFAGEDVIPILHRVGDVVSAIGGDTHTMESVIHALTNMKTKGRVNARDMNIMANAGIPAWESLATQMGYTGDAGVAMVRKMSEAGNIAGETGIRAIMNLADDPRFKDGMAKVQYTFTILKSNLYDLFQQLAVQIGQPIFEGLKEGIQAVNLALMSDEGKRWAADLKAALTSVVAGIKSVVRWAYKYRAEIGAVTKTVLMLVAAGPMLVSILGTVGAVIAFIATKLTPLNLLLTTVAVGIYKAFNDPSTAGPLLAALKKLYDATGIVMEGFWDAWSSIGQAFNNLTGDVGSTFLMIVQSTADFVSKNSGTFKEWASMIGEIIFGLVGMFRGAVGYIAMFFGQFWAENKTQATSTWQDIAKFVTAALDFMAIYVNNFELSLKILWAGMALSSAEAWEGIQSGFNQTVGFLIGAMFVLGNTFVDIIYNIGVAWKGMTDRMIATFGGIKAMIKAGPTADAGTSFKRGWDADMERLKSADNKWREIGKNAGNNFQQGFEVTGGRVIDRTASAKAMEDLKKLGAEWDVAAAKMRAARAERLKNMTTGTDPNLGPGVPPIGPPGMPDLGDESSKGAKTAFTGFADMWKKIQEGVSGGKMLDLAKQTADNTAKTAAASDKMAADTAATRRAIENLNTGLA